MIQESSRLGLKGKGKSYSISQAISWFVVSNILFLGVLIVGLMAFRIDKAMEGSQQAHVSSQIKALAGQITEYLSNREQVLSDHAKFPVFVQGLMQPKTNKGIVQDFINDLNFLGSAYQEVLVDFRGRTIVSSKYIPVFDYQNYAGIQGLLDGLKQSDFSISTLNGKHYWRIAKPVVFNNIVEGALIIEIPLNEIMRQINWSNYLGGISLDIIDNGRLLTKLGDVKSSDTVILEEPLTGAELRFYIDHSEMFAARNRLIMESVILICSVALLMTALSIQLGKRWLVQPIKKLRSCTHDLASGQPRRDVSTDFIVREFVQLAQDFSDMADRIEHRENALRASHQALEKVNGDLKDSQTQLVQSEKMASLGIMAAGVAHEINNPISFVKSNVSILIEYMDKLLPLLENYKLLTGIRSNKQPCLNEEIKRHLKGEDLDYLLGDIPPLLNDTKEGVVRVQGIVEGLKSFARVDEVKPKPFSVNDCVNSTIKVAWNELKYRSKVTTSLGCVPEVCGNQGEINQVVLNLLVNAAQAIDDFGEIHIETGVEEDKVFIRISDTGSGISEEDICKLFTPFYTTKRVGSGTGLGLSISHGIVEKHGGRIDVDSCLGMGSVFTAWLPTPIFQSDVNCNYCLRRA